MTTEQATIAVSTALIVSGIAIVLSATWRNLLRWWTTLGWTPRLTPGIRAEVIMVMGEDGRVGVQFEKIAPEDNANELFAQLTSQWFSVGQSMGISLDWTCTSGTMRETPNGPEYVVALVRPLPVKREIVRAQTEDDA